MDRRKFIIPDKIKDIVLTKIDSYGSNTLLDAEDLTPKSGNLNRKQALHLLRRVSFHPTEEEVEHYTGMNISTAVNLLLGDGDDHLPENKDRLPNPTIKDTPEYLSWYDNAIQDPSTAGALDLRFELEGILKSRYRKFSDWLMLLAKSEDLINNPSREKFTYFLSTIWNIEFTYDTRSYNPPNLLVDNSQTLRKYRVGNYRDIARAMTLDGAFLLYQSLHLSDKSAPNENFARELLELFTMGIGHYSEGDIKEASRILTGWRTAPYFNSRKPNGEFETWFDPNAHDTDSKQFMSTIFPKINETENNEFKVRDEEVYKLIDVIFDVKASEVATFISEKIIKFFLYANESKLNQKLVQSVAQLLLDNDFELRPVYKAIFTSNEFYSDEFIGCQFKSPFEIIAGTSRISKAEINTSLERTLMSQMEQDLYDPPNVSGWKQYRSWVSTSTYPKRVSVSRDIIENMDKDEISNWIKSFDNWQDVNAFFDRLFELLLPKEINPEMKGYSIDGIVFQGQITKAEWENLVNAGNDELATNIIKCLAFLVTQPEYQLT